MVYINKTKLEEFIDEKLVDIGNYSVEQMVYGIKCNGFSGQPTEVTLEDAVDYLDDQFYAKVDDFVDLARKVYEDYENSDKFDYEQLGYDLEFEGLYDIVDGMAFKNPSC